MFLAIKHTKSEKLSFRDRIKVKVRENERHCEPICETFVFSFPHSFNLQQSCHCERFPDSYTCQNYSVWKQIQQFMKLFPKKQKKTFMPSNALSSLYPWHTLFSGCMLLSSLACSLAAFYSPASNRSNFNSSFIAVHCYYTEREQCHPQDWSHQPSLLFIYPSLPPPTHSLFFLFSHFIPFLSKPFIHAVLLQFAVLLYTSFCFSLIYSLV